MELGHPFLVLHTEWILSNYFTTLQHNQTFQLYFEAGGQTINLWSYCLNHLKKYKYRHEAPYPLWNSNYTNKISKKMSFEKKLKTDFLWFKLSVCCVGRDTCCHEGRTEVNVYNSQENLLRLVSVVIFFLPWWTIKLYLAWICR